MPNTVRDIVKRIGGIAVSSYFQDPWAVGKTASLILGPRTKMAPLPRPRITANMLKAGKLLLKPVVRRSKGYQRGVSFRRQPKAELKAYDVSFTNSNFTAVGNFTTLNAMTQGADVFQRIGKKTYMKSIHIRGLIFQNSGATTQDTGRILLIYDRQSNGALPPLASILQDSNAAAGTTNLSEISIPARARFQIIRDYQVALPIAVATGALLPAFIVNDPIKASFNVNMFVKCNLETMYNGTAGTVADIVSGSLFLVTVSGNSNQWGFSFSTRLRYYD